MAGSIKQKPELAGGATVNGRTVLDENGFYIGAQASQTARTTSGLLTAAMLATKIITVNQGAGAASAQQLPTAANMDLAFPNMVANDFFDVSIVNISTVDAEDASVTTNTGWTLVGSMDFQAHSALAAQGSSGILRLRKTAAGAWTAYRIA